MKADRIGALVTALPFAVAGALLFAGWLWASHQRASTEAARPASSEATPATRPDDAGAGARNR